MTQPGKIVLVRFPFADQAGSKPRPALVLRPVPGRHADWLVCMISTQLEAGVPGFDEVVRPTDADFGGTGLRFPSVVRLGRLAVVEERLLAGALGELSPARFAAVLRRLAQWFAPE